MKFNNPKRCDLVV